MTDHTAIERGVALVGEYEKRLRHREPHPEMEICVSQSEMKIIVAALTAAGEMVGESSYEFKGMSLGDENSPRIISPAPASPDVERVAKAIYVALSTAPPEADRNTVAARAALAAIGRT